MIFPAGLFFLSGLEKARKHERRRQEQNMLAHRQRMAEEASREATLAGFDVAFCGVKDSRLVIIYHGKTNIPHVPRPVDRGA